MIEIVTDHKMVQSVYR